MQRRRKECRPYITSAAIKKGPNKQKLITKQLFFTESSKHSFRYKYFCSLIVCKTPVKPHITT